MTTKKSLWEILVPRSSNQGTEYSIDFHRSWDDHVRTIAGGITILKPARGQWVSSEGRLFTEEMIPVRISCTEEALDRILDYTLDHYDQEAVLAYEISINAKLRQRQGVKP